MPATQEQNFANHAKFDPPFHFFLAPLFAANVIVSLVALFRNLNFATAWAFVVAVGLMGLVFKTRIYSLKVQDRVIRLEERLRIAQLCNGSSRDAAGKLTEGQLVALRFASDGELPALVDKTLASNLGNRDIKKAIVNWRADFFRV